MNDKEMLDEYMKAVGNIQEKAKEVELEVVWLDVVKIMLASDTDYPIEHLCLVADKLVDEFENRWR